MSRQVQDWFSPWYGKNVDDVLAEFKMEEMYGQYRTIPDNVVVSLEHVKDRVTIWYDRTSQQVTRITIG